MIPPRHRWRASSTSPGSPDGLLGLHFFNLQRQKEPQTLGFPAERGKKGFEKGRPATTGKFGLPHPGTSRVEEADQSSWIHGLGPFRVCRVWGFGSPSRTSGFLGGQPFATHCNPAIASRWSSFKTETGLLSSALEIAGQERVCHPKAPPGIKWLIWRTRVLCLKSAAVMQTTHNGQQFSHTSHSHQHS